MTDTETAALNKALARAQGVFPAIPQSKKVDTGKFSYTYAPLEAILAAVRPALADNGLAVTQLLDQTNGGSPCLRTELRHADGGVIASSYPIITPGTPQELGSLLTYLRRYALTALLGVATEEDDDGGAAQKATSRKRQPAKQKPKDEPELALPKQLETIGVLISDLFALDPYTDWRQQAREITGGTGEQLSAAAADNLINRLSEQRERLEAARAEQMAEPDDLGDIEF